jgi:hypothetical protein
MRSLIDLVSSLLVEHQISNPSEVRQTVRSWSAKIAEPNARVWFERAASRYINNANEPFLVDFSKARGNLRHRVDDEVKPYLTAIPTLKIFVSPDIIHLTRYDEVDDSDVETSVGKLESDLIDIVMWLNDGANPSGMNFQDAARKARQHAKQVMIGRGLQDVEPILDLKNGWRWVAVKSPEAKRIEGYLMKNCLRHDILGYHASEIIYSLRDPKNRPHVNWSEDSETFGIGNSPVKSVYEPAVRALEDHLSEPKRQDFAKPVAKPKMDAEEYLARIGFEGRENHPMFRKGLDGFDEDDY